MSDSNSKKFNGWAIFSPIQVEKQKLDSAVKTFTRRIILPLSSDFKFVNTNEKWENLMAKEIVRIADSAMETIQTYRFDYDHTSKEVRDYAKPKELTVPHYVLYINLKGTASPESEKEGYDNSIYPGHFEKENGRLARERAQNIAKYIKAMGYPVGIIESTELQLSKDEYWQALKDRSILDKMRYVDVTINILYKRLEVQTLTLPVLLPIWILLSVLTLVFLFSSGTSAKRLKKRSRGSFKIKSSSSYEIWGCFTILAIFFGISFLLKWLTIALIIFTLAVILSIIGLICLFIEKVYEIITSIWQFIKRLPVLIKISVNNALYFLLIWLAIILMYLFIKFIDFLEWWDSLTKCQKVLFFLFPYAVAMTVWNIILYFN